MKKNKSIKKVEVARKKFFSGFKDFISKGNVVDLAVGVIIGGAFGKIVTSLVNDIIMPPIGLLIGGVDFKDLKVVLKDADIITGTAEVAIRYGNFIMFMLEFLIIAFSIYFILTLVIRRKDFAKKVEAELAAVEEVEEVKEEVIVEPSEEILLLREIRDSLKNK
jgi:large conductance mechanosensitive channel